MVVLLSWSSSSHGHPATPDDPPNTVQLLDEVVVCHEMDEEIRRAVKLHDCNFARVEDCPQIIANAEMCVHQT